MKLYKMTNNWSAKENAEADAWEKRQEAENGSMEYLDMLEARRWALHPQERWDMDTKTWVPNPIGF